MTHSEIVLPAEIEVCLSRPGTKMGRTQRIVIDRLLQHRDDGALPTSARFLFYELEQDGLATKPSPDDQRPNKRRSRGWPPGSQDVGDALTALREAGVIPWEWIEDEMRRLSTWSHAPTVADYMADRLHEATLNPWGESAPPMIICESRATAGVLRPTAQTYVCPITGTAGQVGGFLRTAIAPALAEAGGQVLYLGDLDRHGVDIEENSRRVLERELGRELDWRRLGMTEGQVAERALEPIWKVDGRDRKGGWAYEVEALGQATVVALVRDALDALLPERLDAVLARERQQREEFAAFLAGGPA